MKRRFISLLLAIALVLSIFTSSFTITASAGIGLTVKTFGMNKVIDLGYRSIAKITNKALNATGDATGVEEINKAASIINTVLMGSTGNKLNDIKDLCNDILSEINNMHADMEASFSVVEQMLGQQAASNARNKQDEKWNSDVMSVINEYNAEPALEQYIEYMKAAVDYSDDKTNAVAKEKYEQEKEQLIQTFRLMYPGEISVDVLSDPDKLQDLLFTSTAIDDSFINMISKLSANFVKGQNSSNITLAETAAMTANEYFPFSHQQYQFIHTVVGEQLMETAVCMLVASEFFDIQGEYILEKYGEGSSNHIGYINVVNQYYNMITNGSNSVENRINEMLDTKMVIDKYTSKSLMDYMQPEDAVSVNMKIEDFEKSHHFESIDNSVYVDKKYINDKVKFNRVMVNNTIYYIIDKNQFSNKLALSTSALEYKDEQKIDFDVHLPSTDYLNLIKNMSDGANTFKVSGKDTSVYDDLIATNSFALAGNIPEKYLEGYFPDDGTGDSIIITSENEYHVSVSMFHTQYAKYEVIDAKASHSTGTLKTYETSAEYLQPPQGDNQRYSVILSQQSENYQQNLRLESNALGIESAQLVTADNAGNKVTINPNETKKVDSGKNLAINIKLDDVYTVKSIKCIRDNDLFSSSGTSESYIIESAEEFSTINSNEDGSYTINYSVPYSDAKIVIETEEKNDCVYNENGFCTVCGAYQPATLNNSGVYEISNAGQLFWFASLVNGDRTNADFDKQDVSADAVLVKDIDLESREWMPVMSYNGTFDGQNHTISNLKITKISTNSGLFGSASGTIKNFAVKGEITLSSNGSHIGGVLGNADGATVTNVSSYVNISNSNGELKHIGGVIGSIQNNETFVDKCVYYGNIDVKNSYDCIGGIIAYTNSGGRISNCANHGFVTASTQEAYIGGILGYVNNSDSTVKNCYNYGTISNGDSTNHCGAIIGWARIFDLSNITNNYYLKGSASLAFGSDSSEEASATAKNAEEFKSGEVAYLLNNSVTDGTQVWYQNIDNGESPDIYPVFEGGTVYCGYKCDKNKKLYSNFPLSDEPTAHDFNDNGFCAVCGAYQPATINSNGVYEISNAGQLYWFASLVNGDSTHADFDKRNSSANAVLTADIDLESREFTPIGNYSSANKIEYKGKFDGQNHIISGFKITQDYDSFGLFGRITGTVENFTIMGDILLYRDASAVGGAVGNANGAVISNVSSYVNISRNGNKAFYVGGIIGYCNEKCTIQKCANYGNISGSDYVGGIVGNFSGSIENCYNVGAISGNYSCGGIFGIVSGTGYSAADISTAKNCYNYGTVSCGSNGAAISPLPGLTAFSNCCYLDTCGTTDKNGTSKTAEQFSSGEIAYLLNNSVTDGTQVWYQNIDNGKTPDAYPVFDGGTVYYGYKCNNEGKVYSNYPLSSSPTGHKFDSNGFCTVCGAYQPATLNNNGVYEISNAGQLFWFASLVNGDRSNADFDKQDTSADAVLVKDIDLENREWMPIMNFTGEFDGQNHTISNLKITKTSTNSGLFGSTSGTIKNFTVKGEITLSSSGNHIGGAVGNANGGSISNVASYVNISNTNGAVGHIGGVVGSLETEKTYVDKCVYYGNINIENSHDCIGGIAAYSNNGGRISNCANYGSVKTTKDGAYTGGVLGYVNNTEVVVKDCYNYGTVSNGDSTKYCGAIIGWARNYSAGNISNNYYLENSSSYALGTDGKSGAEAVSKTALEFASGEVAYLLNHKITDGTQVWHQNIDNGEIPDDYPVFEGGTVYYLSYKDAYSNTYSEKPAAPDDFDVDDDGNLIIRTYDDLVKLSQLIRSEYDVYGSQKYVLVNNIKADDSSEWTQGIGSVADNKPFSGTFDGKGYCIIGLNVNAPEYGGLFEIIGESGCVKNLFVLDCDYKASSKTAGGIAALNNGTIDHCVSGVNLTTGVIHLSNITIDAVELNSIVKGEESGGITAENSGLIIGCRNASVVSGTQCGGIACINTGKIYGCANNGKIGSSNSSVSGGLAGKNGGTIESSYNSGNVYAKSENIRGAIAGINGYDEYTPSVTNVFYLTANGLKAVGSDSINTPDETNIGMSKSSDFKSSSFVDKLNEVSDDAVVWIFNSYLNNGYPTIKSNVFEICEKSAGNNITVKGSMHRDLNIRYDICDENDSVYKLLAASIGKNKIIKAYSLNLTDKDGNYIPAELWCQGDFMISVPVEGKNVQLAGTDSEDKVVYYKPDSVENGNAVFTVSAPMSFAIVDVNENNNIDNKSVNNNNADNSNNVNNSKTINDNTPIQTGSMVLSTALIAALCLLILVLSIRRRNKIG